MQSKSLTQPNATKHPFNGEAVLFVTKHGKEEILAPLVLEVGMKCVRADVDTDQFGTFTGKVKRIGTVRETLRKKIQAAFEVYPNDRFFLASEGSFGPHPIIGFVQTDLESLLLWDRKHNIGIYAEYLCASPIHGEQKLGPRDDFRKALKDLSFPDHGVIIHPENSIVPIFNGLHREHDVAQAMIDCLSASSNGYVVIANDLRACHNPTRRNAICEAGKIFLEKLKTLCPSCAYPGYSITKGVSGLPCFGCGEQSPAAKSVIYVCVRCPFSEERPRPDGKLTIDLSECEFCNP